MDLFRRFFSKSNTAEETETKTAPPPLAQEDQTGDAGTAEGVSESAETKSTVSPMPRTADGVTRPLPPETLISSQNEHITFGQSTDVGLERRNNQDSALSIFFTSRSVDERPDLGLFVVADGMGGHHDGEKASAIAVRTVATYVTNSVYLPILNPEIRSDSLSIVDTLVAAVQKANAEVLAKVPEGGTTVSAVAIMGDLAFIAHVGDSRVYLITRDGMEQITRDHSLVQRLIELDQITPQEASDHPQKNVLYRAIGQNETLEVDALTRRLTPNSRMLICSDGLWGQVSEKEILEIITAHSNPQEACDKLVALANTRGGVDNITTILLKIPSN